MHAAPNTSSAPRFNVLNGDALEELKRLPDNHFDGCISDVPYGLSVYSRQTVAKIVQGWVEGRTEKVIKSGGFLSNAWDLECPPPAVFAELFRVMKPGAYAVIFAGARTQDLIGLSARLGGFVLCDTVAWAQAEGFPKGVSVDKALAALELSGGSSPRNLRQVHQVDETFKGYKSALKPNYEPALVLMKPLDGTYANNAKVHGLAGFNIDGNRVPLDSETDLPKGRYPGNLIMDEAVATAMDAEVGALTSGSDCVRRQEGYFGVGGVKHGGLGDPGDEQTTCGDTGGPSRFFQTLRGKALEAFEPEFPAVIYCGKARSKERNAGLDLLPDQDWSKAGVCVPERANRPFKPSKNAHPCVKPLRLLQKIGSLICPPTRKDGQPRRLIVPFSGSGSEMAGALLAGWDEVTGIERSAEYCEVARLRCAYWTSTTGRQAFLKAQGLADATCPSPRGPRTPAEPSAEQLQAIASSLLGVHTLSPRNSDSLDFHDIGVVQLRAALVAAYREGAKAALSATRGHSGADS